jgi:hypothetical protein
LRLHGISLAGAAPGAYELVLSMKDEVAGRVLERREPFEIEPVAPPHAEGTGGPG